MVRKRWRARLPLVPVRAAAVCLLAATLASCALPLEEDSAAGPVAGSAAPPVPAVGLASIAVVSESFAAEPALAAVDGGPAQEGAADARAITVVTSAYALAATTPAGAAPTSPAPVDDERPSRVRVLGLAADAPLTPSPADTPATTTASSAPDTSVPATTAAQSTPATTATTAPKKKAAKKKSAAGTATTTKTTVTTTKTTATTTKTTATTATTSTPTTAETTSETSESTATTTAAPPPSAGLTWVGSRVFFYDYSYGVDWDMLAYCEATNIPTITNPSGKYRGLFQFDLATWKSVGGEGDPAKADPTEQLARAHALYRSRGLQPWGCRGYLDRHAGENVPGRPLP